VLLNTLIAAALGLVLGIGLAVLLDRRTVREDVGVREADEEGAPA
jgi:capsular polysaccharide biosynthesis protein